jgi:hypothetical protein
MNMKKDAHCNMIYKDKTVTGATYQPLKIFFDIVEQYQSPHW